MNADTELQIVLVSQVLWAAIMACIWCVLSSQACIRLADQPVCGPSQCQRTAWLGVA
jgi:hypothetical protein